MKEVGTIYHYPVFLLSRDIAKKYAKDIARLVNTIPLVQYSEKEVLAEAKEDREFYSKWKHSLVVFDDKKPIGVIIGYERKSEDNNQYSLNSLYISELAISEQLRNKGIARQLIKLFLDNNKKFFTLDGDVVYSIQTNSADWNQHVIKLYESFGFKKIAEKQYENRKDVILYLSTHT